MELVVENGWKGNGWMLDRLASFRREVEEAIEQHTPPRAEVVEDKDAYHHYYVEMPGLSVGPAVSRGSAPSGGPPTCRWRTIGR